MTSVYSDDGTSRYGSPYGQNVLEWDVERVSRWVSDLGLTQYGLAFRENNIAGEVLVYLGHSELSEIGVQSVGHRLKILKAIYQLIVNQKLELDSEYYIPPTALEKESVLSLKGLPNIDATIVHSFEVRDERMSYAENEIRKLLDSYSRLREDLLPIFRIVKESKPLPTPDPPLNFSSVSPNPFYGSQPLHSISSPNVPMTGTNNSGFQRSPTSNAIFSSPTRLNSNVLSTASTSRDASSSSLHNMPKITSKKSFNALNQAVKSPTNGALDEEVNGNGGSSLMRGGGSGGGGTIGGGSRVSSQNSASGSNASTPLGVGSVTPSPSSEPFKAFRLTQDDPCYKVLPAALKKYKINGDWRQYALLVCYGDQERLLGLEEKPLVIFKELQDAGRRPVFMLRHIEGAKNNKQGGVVVNGTPGGVI
jgi:protein STE50